MKLVATMTGRALVVLRHAAGSGGPLHYFTCATVVIFAKTNSLPLKLYDKQDNPASLIVHIVRPVPTLESDAKMNRSLRVKLKRVAELADGAFQKKYVVKGTTFQVNDEDTVRDALQDAIDKLEAVPENQMTVEVDLKEHLAQLYHDMGLIHFNHAAADDAGGCFARGIGNLVAVKAVYAGRVSQDQFTKAAMQCAIKKEKLSLFDWAQVLDNTSHEGGDVDRNLMDLSLNLYDQGFALQLEPSYARHVSDLFRLIPKRREQLQLRIVALSAPAPAIAPVAPAIAPVAPAIAPVAPAIAHAAPAVALAVPAVEPAAPAVAPVAPVIATPEQRAAVAERALANLEAQLGAERVRADAADARADAAERARRSADQAHRASSVGSHLEGGGEERRHFTMKYIMVVAKATEKPAFRAALVSFCNSY